LWRYCETSANSSEAPYWHLPSDTRDKLDEAVMDRAYRFAREMIGAIDERRR